ncbi:low temperature requirement protein A [Flexivirga meconopsidis]|uniref:low temperature requirement protein A n=1 Tax=Flexivirga meconopsidis TaxID=2977121 RepID=UPI00223F093A|nr:low temperature requirement protein A [Flexivirga meconopsidis]
MSNPQSPADLVHRLTPMRGRDPEESERASTPLELLLDLTFVVAVGTAASHFAEVSAAGHIGNALLAFLFAMFAICVAWINFAWFASAFDTDDWLYRALTMVAMVGVVVFALGLPPMFNSVEEGQHVDNRLIVIGYIVMRIAMAGQWWRAARQSSYRRVALRNIGWVMIAQVGWVIVAWTSMSMPLTFVCALVLGIFELLLPVLSQGQANGTPWHPHHIAERYSLFAIITLGEGVVGTVASSQGLLGGESGTDWSGNAVAVVVAGIGLTFGMWWVYFITPFGTILQYRPRRGYLFGYGHIPIFIAIAATGAGLHVMGLYLEHEAKIGHVTTTLLLAVPVAIYLGMVFVLHDALLSAGDALHFVQLGVTALFLVAAVVVAMAGAPLAVSLILIMIAPFVTVVSHELGAYRHQARMLQDMVDDAP